jgi:hypothetical protein
VRNNIKSVFLVFSIVAAGGVVYGLARGHGIGETLIATVMAAGFLLGIAWVAKRADARLKRK